MKYYAAMSDQDINCEVLFSTSPGVTRVHLGDNGMWYFYVPENSAFAAKVAIPDYCNNPADAWPIIVSNQISLMYEEATGKWCAGKPYWVDGCEWQLDIDAMEANPLRAAMIVFLMMKESEK